MFTLSATIVPAVGSRRCSRTLLRNFSSSRPRRLSSKRLLQTATAHRPQTLDAEALPPHRNSGVPDTSIAGGIPEVNDTRPPKFTQHDSQPQDEACGTSLNEAEEQRPKPIAAKTASVPEATPAGTTSTAKPRSKLRPRKAAITLTPSATQQLRTLLSQPEPKLIRVGVKNRGCSGLSYHLEYVQKPGAFDEMVEQDGVKVLVDSKALFSIIGSEMDWVEDKLNRRFVFRNPNISKWLFRRFGVDWY
jgi:iron-sulfur cluster assembly protein